MGRRLRTPSQQAQLAYQQRGNIRSKPGYTQFHWNIHPDDQYLRVFPDGPYDRAWEGIQKDNYITHVGMLRAASYGDEPMYLQQLRQHSGTVQQVNWAAYSQGAGPAVIAAQQGALAQQQAARPSLFQSFLSRLRGQ